MRKIKYIISTLLVLSILFTLPVHAAGSYESVYAGALSEASARHNQMIASGEILPDWYDRILYVLSDITGDGNPELIIQQITGKHAAEYWIYGNNGSSSYYMGEFSCDADLMYGYRIGILYRDSYKGSVTLGLAEWTGSGFTNTVLYSGIYDRNGEPPTIEQLSNYYDSGRLLGKIPDFYYEGKDLSTVPEQETTYQNYANARFGYSISYPSFFVQDGPLPANGDGIMMSGNGARLTMSGSYNVMNDTPDSYYREYVSYKNNLTGYHVGDNYVEYYSLEGTTETYSYTQIDDLCVSFYLEYPAAEHDQYSSIIDEMKKHVMNH